MNKRKKLLPINGSEIPYSEEPWRTHGIRSNNCYAYAVNDFETFRVRKSVPGDRSGKSSEYHSYTNCKGLPERVLSDNPGKIYKAKATEKCKKDYYKMMMVVAPKNQYGTSHGDFHFYKQHGKANHVVKQGDTCKSIAEMFDIPVSRIYKAKGANKPLRVGMKLIFNVNLFSHKRGWATGPLLKDACGKPIRDPRMACRKYGYDYSKYCCSFCVKNRGIDVGKTHPKVTQGGFKIF